MALPEVKVRVSADTKLAEAALSRIKAALAAMNAASAKVTGAARTLGRGLTNLGAVSNSARGKIQLVSYQLQDIIVQMQMGTRTSTVMSQQLPQLAGAFGAVGAAIGVGVAVAIPMISALMDMRGEAETLEDRLEGLEDVTSSLKDNLDLLRFSAEEMTIKFGEAARRVNELAVAQAELRVGLASDALKEQIAGLDSVITQYKSFSVRGSGMSKALNRIKDDFDLSSEAARKFSEFISELDSATTFEDQQAALVSILDLLRSNGIALSEIPPELARALDEMINLSNETDRARELMRQLSAEAASITVGVPLYAQTIEGGLLPPTPLEVKKRSGRGRVEKTNSRLNSLIDQLQTERETIDEWYAEGLALLEEANAKELEVLGGHANAKLRIEKEYQDRLANIKDEGRKYSLESVLGGGAEILGALGSTNKKALKISQAFAAAEALVSTYKGAAKELEKGTLGFATAAAVIARGLSFVAAIKGIGASGGTAGGTATSAAAAPEPQRGSYYNVSLVGEGSIPRGAVRDLIGMINDEVSNGAVLRGITVN